MSRKALGTAVAKIKNSPYLDFYAYSVPPNGEDEHFLSFGGMNLSGEDTSDTEKLSEGTKYTPHATRRRWHISTIIAIILSILVATLLFALGALIDRKPPSISYVPASTDNLEPAGWPLVEAGDHVIVDCGNSPEEAKAIGCVWDLMSFSWTHPACYNKNESDAFLEKYGPWKWFKNENNKPLEEEVADEDLPYNQMVWTQEHYHIAHCSYIFKLLYIAAMSGHLMTNEGIGMFHTNHCVSVFLDPERVVFEKVTTRVQLLYGKCVTIRDVN